MRYYKYQVRLIKRLLSGASFMVWILPGKGKTLPVIRWLWELKNRGDQPRTLLISTELIIYNVWPDEINEYPRFRGLRYDICHGSTKDKVIDLVHEGDFDIVATTPDTFVTLYKTYPAMFQQFDKLVVDESTKFKDPTRNRYKQIHSMLKKYPNINQRIAMTGTPQPNGELQLFSQFWIVGKEKVFGGNSFYADFQNIYFYKPEYTFKWRLLPGAEEKIDELIAPWIFQPRQSEYNEMPPIIEYLWHVDLPPKILKLHKDMLKNKAIKVKGKDILAANAAVAANKCLQISSGIVYRYDDPTNPSSGREPIRVHTVKDTAIQELHEAVGAANVLILYNYVHEYERLVELFPDSMDIAKDKGAIQAWNRGKLSVATAHPASMAHGLNLQKGGNILIFFGPNQDLELVEQVKKRLHRGSIKEPVYVYHLIARGTRDEDALELVDKKSIQQQRRMARHEGA